MIKKDEIDCDQTENVNDNEDYDQMNEWMIGQSAGIVLQVV